MKTLTHFINLNNANLTNINSSQPLEINEASTLDQNAQYEVIESETLDNGHLENLTVSGSLFSLTSFNTASLRSCVFFASKMENCTFTNCVFENCTFEFSTLLHCNFVGCVFKNCSWNFTQLKKSEFKNCSFDGKTLNFVSETESSLSECFCNEAITWEEVMACEENEIELLEDDVFEEEEETQVKSNFLSSFKNSFKKLAA